jgi:protein-L-isoaspartate(D-aspartate) O-methyltransferase
MEEIAAEARYSASYTGLGAFDPRVMAAMETVPRHEFVPPGERDCAWINRPLSIGHGQTISQPFIVALMSTLLQPRPEDAVLEVGTGCGYQAAILAGLVARVYTIELVAELAADAAARLKRLGYDNVEVRAGDGAKGWPEHGPFDGIIVTAGAPEIPPALVEQLKPGGRLVIPVNVAMGQELVVVTRLENGGIESRPVLPVAFVPLRGG